MNTFTDADRELIAQAMYKMLADKKEAYEIAQAEKLPFTARDFGIPQVESIIERIEKGIEPETECPDERSKTPHAKVAGMGQIVQPEPSSAVKKLLKARKRAESLTADDVTALTDYYAIYDVAKARGDSEMVQALEDGVNAIMLRCMSVDRYKLDIQ